MPPRRMSLRLVLSTAAAAAGASDFTRAVLSASAAAAAAGASDFTHAVASDVVSAGASPSWLDGLPTWHVGTDVVPASPALPADAPARDMVFGSPLSWSVGPGLNASSSFQLELTFLDDGTGAQRVLALSAGGAVVAPRIALPAKAALVARFNVSGAAISGGSLALSLANLAGPNAVLSAFTLYSSWPGDAPLTPTAPPGPSHALPRLTPRPASVAGAAAGDLYMELHGVWDFSATGEAGDLTPILVPGEYTLQGYRVAAGQPVLYQRLFTPPAAWAALRVKLRCDGVYSNATVFVNGELVGAHLGGMTPFEFDVTDQLQPGTNTLTVLVVGASLADALAAGAQYATHDLGGITRKIGLLAVPAVSVADVHVVTAFAAGDYTAATLALNISVANDGAEATAAPVNVAAALAYQGAAEAAGSVAVAPGLAGGGAVAFASLNLSVTAPPLWDPEHPRLHDLTLTLTLAGGATEVVSLRVGFRDVRVVGGNRVAVNGRVIKARGTTRHEAHPLAGRSLWRVPPEGKQWERDIAQFAQANINYIRTSHYPPADELMAAADELGMLIELEMPFCWASGNSGPAAFNYTVQAQREAIVANRNHPSVIHWSLGNESPWTPNFARALQQYLRELDGTRLFMFDGGEQQPVPPLDILSVHYPSFDGPGQYANGSQPTLFGEYGASRTARFLRRAWPSLAAAADAAASPRLAPPLQRTSTATTGASSSPTRASATSGASASSTCGSSCTPPTACSARATGPALTTIFTCPPASRWATASGAWWTRGGAPSPKPSSCATFTRPCGCACRRRARRGRPCSPWTTGTTSPTSPRWRLSGASSRAARRATAPPRAARTPPAAR